jgi:hypothetical protein
MMNRYWTACLMAPLLAAFVAAQTATVPFQHIEAARTLLNQIQDKSLKKNARDHMMELRKLFGGMVEAYTASRPDWRTKFSAVESELTRIIGGGRGPWLETTRAGLGSEAAGGVTDDAPGAPSNGAQTSGVLGTVAGFAGVGDIGIKDLDPAIREPLRQFRLEVELFFASALTDSAGVSGPSVPFSTPPEPK